MRTVWAQATRPRLSCAPAPRSSLKSIAARRSAAASAARSQIAACDVFALFLGPVLALAAFADVSWKDKKRKEWEQRFAEINQQLELLRAREIEVWTRIQYRSVHHGLLQQKRMYSSAAAVVAQAQPSSGEDVEADHHEMSLSKSDPGLTAPEDGIFAPLGLSALSYRHGDDISPPPAPRSDADRAADSSLVHYEKLLALRLALRMILYNHTGSDDMYADAFCDNTAPDVDAADMGRVVFRLRAVTGELEAIDRRRQFARDNLSFRRSSYDDIETREVRRKEIMQLGRLFRNKQIDLAGLIDRISQLLLQTDSKAPGPALYAELVMLFSLNNLPDLSRFAVSALQNTSYALSDYEICLMLDHSSIMKNMKAYDWVIHNLTDKDGLLATDSWEWQRISGILLPLPIDRNAYMIRALIRTALNFKLPMRAEAYAKLESTFYSRSMMAYVIKAFLQYYTFAQDWANTYRWLRKAQVWTGTLPASAHGAVGAVMGRVLDALLAFDKIAEYDQLLLAVVTEGIEPPNLDKREREGSDRMRRVVGQWRRLINISSPTRPNLESLSNFKKCMRVVIGKLKPAELLLEQNLGDQPALVGTSPSIDDITSTGSSSAPNHPSDDTVLRSEQALGRLDEQITESRRLHAKLEKQETEIRKEQQPAVTQSDISMLKDLITREREDFNQIRLEQETAIKEQEATVAALRQELITREHENSERIRLEQERAMKEQQATIEALRRELRENIEIRSEERKTIQVSEEEPEAALPLPLSYTDARKLRRLLKDVFSEPSPTRVSHVLAWAKEAESLPASVPEDWPPRSDDTPTKAHCIAKRHIVFGMKKSKFTLERLQVEAETAWTRAQEGKKAAGLEQQRDQPAEARAAATAEPAASAQAMTLVVDGAEPENDSGYDSDSPSAVASSPSVSASSPPPAKSGLSKPFRKVGVSPEARSPAIRRITVGPAPVEARWIKSGPSMPSSIDRAARVRDSLDDTTDVLQAWDADTWRGGDSQAAVAGANPLFHSEHFVDLRGGTKLDRG